jgi:hypothetical protein
MSEYKKVENSGWPASVVSGIWCGVLLNTAIQHARSRGVECVAAQNGPSRSCSEGDLVKWDMCHMTSVMLAVQLLAHAFLVFAAYPIWFRRIVFVALPVVGLAYLIFDEVASTKDPWRTLCFSGDDSSACEGAILALRIAGLSCAMAASCWLWNNDDDDDVVSGGRPTSSDTDRATVACIALVLLSIATILSIAVYLCFYALIYIDSDVLVSWFAPPRQSQSVVDIAGTELYGTCPAGEVLLYNQIIHVVPMLINLSVIVLNQEKNRTTVENLNDIEGFSVLRACFPVVYDAKHAILKCWQRCINPEATHSDDDSPENDVALSILLAGLTTSGLCAAVYVTIYHPNVYYSGELAQLRNVFILSGTVLASTFISACVIWYGLGERESLVAKLLL